MQLTEEEITHIQALRGLSAEKRGAVMLAARLLLQAEQRMIVPPVEQAESIS